MVSTIAALLFLTAISLAFWAIGNTLYTHAGQISGLMSDVKSVPSLPVAMRRCSDIRRPVSVTALRRSSLRAAA